jgi:hypothetical protein
MQRTVWVAVAAAVVAAAVAIGATLAITNDGDELAISSPAPTAQETPKVLAEVVTPEPSPTQTPEPGETAKPAARTAAPTVAPVTTHSVPVRSASSVDCSDEPEFCADSVDGMTRDDSKFDSQQSATTQTTYSGVPRVSQDSGVYRFDGKPANKGDTIGRIKVDVEVSNDTSKTFVFAKREIVLDLYRNGKLYDRLVTTGPGFEMTPKSKMTATFKRDIISDGYYEWQAKTWYYEK